MVTSCFYSTFLFTAHGRTASMEDKNAPHVDSDGPATGRFCGALSD